jgi:hypothetical protein
LTKTTQDLILDWLQKIDDKVDKINQRLTKIESKNFATVEQVTGVTRVIDAAISAHVQECQREKQRASIMPTAPVKKFDGKVRVDLVQVAKIIGLIVSMIAAAAGYDIVIN